MPREELHDVADAHDVRGDRGLALLNGRSDGRQFITRGLREARQEHRAKHDVLLRGRVDRRPEARGVGVDHLGVGVGPPLRADELDECVGVDRLYVGRTQDYNRATAEAAARVAEELGFAPERREEEEEEEVYNRVILPKLGARHWEVRASGPPLLSEEVLIKLVELGIEANVVTPAQVAEMLEPLLGQELTLGEVWAKLPVKFLDALAASGKLPPEFAKAFGGSESASTKTRTDGPAP